MTDDNVTNIHGSKPTKEQETVIIDSNQWKSDLINLLSVVFGTCVAVGFIGGFVWGVWWLLSNFIGHIVFGACCGFAGFVMGKDSR